MGVVSEEIENMRMRMSHQANQHGGHLLLNQKDTKNMLQTLQYFSEMVEQMEAAELASDKKEEPEASNVISFKHFKERNLSKRKGDVI